VQGAPVDALGAVFYGVNGTNIDAWNRVRQRGQDWYYIDNSYFDKVRGQQYRVTKNRIQVKVGDKTSDGKRFAALGIEIKPWLDPSDEAHWVFIEQSPSFMRDVANDPNWLPRRLAEVKDKRRVVVRSWESDKLKVQKSLVDDLRGAWALVTYSSAAAVTAVAEGVFSVVEPMSSIAGMTCSKIDSVQDERLRYLSVLADNQFTIEELRDGKAWACLNDR
jgi:hypothetical protein